MSIPAPRTFNLGNQLLQRAGANIDEAISSIVGVPIVQGQFATFTLTVDIAAGTYFTLNHGLGRTPTGVLACVVPYKALKTPSGGASFALGPATSAPDLTVNLLCSADLLKGSSLSFWVF